MKVWKKLSALALSLMLVLALCAPAFAADPTFGDMDSANTGTNEDGVLGEFDTSGDNAGKVKYTYADKYVLLYKEITAHNADNATVNAPTIQYNYAIAKGTGSKENAEVTVKDSFGTQVQVKEGIETGVAVSGAVAQSDNNWTYKTSVLEFTPVVQLKNGKNVFPIKVDFSNVEFGGAGVYRYIITETVEGATEDTEEKQTAAKNAAGIVDGTISNVRYLDVYVKDADDAATKTGAAKYEIYGFVCFQNLQTPDAIDGTTDTGNVTAIAKTEGFVADKGANGTTELTADTYNTFNVEVSKTLVNDQAMLTHQFPFNVTITNTSVTAAITLKSTNTADKVTRGSGITDGNVSGTLDTSITEEPKIADSANIKYIGIPVGATTVTTVSVYETNDVTGTTYTSTYKVDTGNATGSKSISWVATGDAYKSNTATVQPSGAGQADSTSHKIAFTNTLLNISPTGVTLRYAPYMAMMGLGVVALPLSLRKKEELD